jgi:hypothetical protein
VAIEVFPGNTADPKCFSSEALTVAKRFNLGKIVFVGDRVMITSARIKDQFKDADGLDWITTLHSVDIRVLAEEGTVDKSVFDDCDHKEVTSETFSGERLAASMSNWSSLKRLSLDSFARPLTLSATGKCEKDKCCMGSVRIAVPDEKTGLKFLGRGNLQRPALRPGKPLRGHAAQG